MVLSGETVRRDRRLQSACQKLIFFNGDCRDGSDRPDEHLVCPVRGCSFLWSLDRALGFWQDRWSIGRRIEGGPGFTSRATFLNVTVEMNPPLEKP